MNAERMKTFGKVEELYLGNTNLVYALSENKPDIGNLRETFFFSQMRKFKNTQVVQIILPFGNSRPVYSG